MPMRLSASGAQHKKDEARSVSFFNSMWKPGDTLVAFYPAFYDDETGKWEQLVGATWGHKVNDMKALGIKRSFIPTTTEVEKGVPVGIPDVTYQFARIARLAIDGQKQADINKVLGKNYKTETEKLAALKKVEDRFDTQKTKDAPKPVVGKLTYLITTECFVIQLTGDTLDNLDFQQSGIVSQELSGDRISQISQFLNNPATAPTEDFPYVEVVYTFPPSSDKGESGRKVAPQGATNDVSLRTKFPNEWPRIESECRRIADDSELIMARNYSYREMSLSELNKAFSAYAMEASEYFDSLAEDEDKVKQIAKCHSLLEEYNVLNNIKEEAIHAAIDELIAQEKAGTEGNKYDAEDQKNIDQLQNDSHGNAPTADQLRNNAAHDDSDESEFKAEDVSL